MRPTDLQSLLKRNDWFRQLPDSSIEELVNICKQKSLTKGQRLHAKGDQPDGFYCLLAGKIRVSNVNSQGKEIVLTWLTSGSWFGEISLFDGLPRTHDAFAEQASQLLVIPIQQFHALLDRQPQLHRHFMRLLCQRIRATFALIDEVGGLSLQGQLAKRLLLLSHGLAMTEQNQAPAVIEISQESLARMLNSSRQTVNRLLAQFKQQGLVTLQYGKIELRNTQALVQLSQL